MIIALHLIVFFGFIDFVPYLSAFLRAISVQFLVNCLNTCFFVIMRINIVHSLLICIRAFFLHLLFNGFWMYGF